MRRIRRNRVRKYQGKQGYPNRQADTIKALIFTNRRDS